MAKILLIIMAIMTFGAALFCFVVCEPIATSLGLKYYEGVIIVTYPFGSLSIVLGVMFLIASKDPVKRRFIMDMGILYCAIGFVSSFIMLARLGSLPIVFWISHFCFNLIFLILLIVSRPKAATT